jgi:hypothetical protein
MLDLDQVRLSISPRDRALREAAREVQYNITRESSRAALDLVQGPDLVASRIGLWRDGLDPSLVELYVLYNSFVCGNTT